MISMSSTVFVLLLLLLGYHVCYLCATIPIAIPGNLFPVLGKAIPVPLLVYNGVSDGVSVSGAGGSGSGPMDLSEIEFYPIQEPGILFAANGSLMYNGNGIRDLRETAVVLALIDSFKNDSVDEERPRILMNAKYIQSLRAKYPSMDLSRYILCFKGIRSIKDRKFNQYTVERVFGLYRETRPLASIMVQRRVNFGRKVVRFAFIQSYNEGSMRDIWLTDDLMWRAPLKHIGQVHSREGWAIMWSTS